MGQLYRWIDKQTGQIVYVGQVAGNTIEDIYTRIKTEKTQCPWTKDKEYIIQYLSGKLLGRDDFNKNETTALETHFINTYRTGEYGFNRNYQITGGTMSFVPDSFESAWEELPSLTRQTCSNCLEPPFDKLKLSKVQESFIRNGERLLELEEIFFYVLFDFVHGLIRDGKITVYCNEHLGFTFGITFNGHYYGFFDGAEISCDTCFSRCINGAPIDPNIFHWTGRLLPDTVTNLIECKPYLDDLREKVMKAKHILEQYNPSLIDNPNARRFQEVYEDLKESKQKEIDKLHHTAIKKTKHNRVSIRRH